ncbi:hypothetical protein Q8A67_014365 [Cirrhinus molitorella]|uniref:Uncharacterized protein n=1 Tax=Cirrhinus molitorella TaxID=172907 RepID=A0AA88PGG3_9TELE|nr:hypothetical protein Q8A67_014365 [Cirrhinus molitorella]
MAADSWAPLKECGPSIHDVVSSQRFRNMMHYCESPNKSSTRVPYISLTPPARANTVRPRLGVSSLRGLLHRCKAVASPEIRLSDERSRSTGPGSGRSRMLNRDQGRLMWTRGVP